MMSRYDRWLVTTSIVNLRTAEDTLLNVTGIHSNTRGCCWAGSLGANRPWNEGLEVGELGYELYCGFDRWGQGRVHTGIITQNLQASHTILFQSLFQLGMIGTPNLSVLTVGCTALPLIRKLGSA